MSAQWIFGYGSLIWRPGFAYEKKAKAYVMGWKRRFWQASPDHRGTASAPGRVVTLVAEPGSQCWGMAYQISKADAPAILAVLDHREKAGYVQVRTPLHVEEVGTIDDVLVYVADTTDKNYLGECDEQTIAESIASARGPSGSNREYLLKLAKALNAMNIEDSHVERLRLTIDQI